MIELTPEEAEAIRVLVLGELGDTQRVDIDPAVCRAILVKLRSARPRCNVGAGIPQCPMFALGVDGANACALVEGHPGPH